MTKVSVINTAVAIAFTVTLGACSNMSTRDQRMLSGAAIGAGGGALIGAATGSAAAGAAIGAGAGAVGGYLYDKDRR